MKNQLIDVSIKTMVGQLPQIISKNNEYIENFGCSDCDCNSHLYYFKNRKEAIDEVINAYNTIACPFKIGISDFS